MKNLQDEDIDLRNLYESISTHKRLWKPILHIFELDSKAKQETIDCFVDKIMNWIFQDIQTFINRNAFEILRKTYNEDRENQGKESIFEFNEDDFDRASYIFREVSSVNKTQDKLNKSNNEFIEKMLIHMQQEKDILERKLLYSNFEFNRERFYSAKFPESSEISAKIIMDEDKGSDRNHSVFSINADNSEI